MSEQPSVLAERIDVKGDQLVHKVKQLMHEGDVRRISINDSDGRTVLDMPVTVGVIGFLVAPSITAIGTLGALEADYSIDVERERPGTEASVVPASLLAADIKREERAMERYRSLLEEYIELYNAGDLDGVMDLYADDAVQIMPDGTFEGRGVIAERLAKELTAFPDVHHRFISYVEQDDAFADEWVFEGTHAGPLLLPDGTELPPTGKRIEVRGMELCKVRDGKIIVDNLYYDNLSVAAQLGVLPQGAPAAV